MIMDIANSNSEIFMTKYKTIIFFLIVIFLLFFGILSYKNYFMWEEITSSNYGAKGDNMSMAELYHQYERDMRLMPPIQSLSTAIARRGKLGSDAALRKLKEDGSLENLRNSIIVFEEIKRIGSYNFCADQDYIREIQKAFSVNNEPSMRNLVRRARILCE